MFALFGLSSRLVHWGSRGVGSNGSSMAISLSGLRGVDRGALVADFGDEAVDVVGGVLGGLDPAVRQSDHIAASNNTVGILGLGLLEVGLAVVISDSVLVGEWLRGELLLLVGGGLVVSRGRGIGGGGSVGHGDLVGDGDSEESGGESDLRIGGLDIMAWPGNLSI